MATNDGFPFNVESFIATLARLMASQGRTIEVALLAEGRASAFKSSYDNRDGGIYGYTIRLEVPAKLFSRLSEQQVKDAESALTEGGRPFFRGMPHDGLDGFAVVPMLNAVEEDWRDGALAWLRGEGVNNQGRVRSDNIASRQHDGLLFRSGAEIELYKALKSKGVSLAPLPVFVRGGATYRRIEPDFLLIKGGVVLCVEVDGDTVHQETPAEAHDRTTMLLHEGVHVERVKASEVSSPEKAEAVASRLVALMDKYRGGK